MKRNFIVLGCAGMLAFGLSFSAFAGSAPDVDSDGVPDAYDNCKSTANGPLLPEIAQNFVGDVAAGGHVLTTFSSLIG